MEEFKKEYTLLFNGITDTVKELERLTAKMKHLQVRAEEAHLGHHVDLAQVSAEMNIIAALDDEDFSVMDE